MEIPTVRPAHPDLIQQGKNYAAARNSRASHYQGVCLTHGWQNFETKNKKCPLCRKRAGAPYKDGARAEARRVGHKDYLGECAAHGTVAHSVAHGKCLSCFNSVGARRVNDAGGRPQFDTPRAIARRAGESWYPDECGAHGWTRYSTIHAKCLDCFTSTGHPRKTMPYAPPNAS
jgi:hypothetical protein